MNQPNNTLKKFNIFLKKTIRTVRLRINLIIFLVSISSLLFVCLKLLNIESIFLASKNLWMLSIFQALLILSSIFIVLFLPTYPIFFNLKWNKNFKFREKLCICFVFNQAFFIILGFFGALFNIPITFTYFFLTLTITFPSILVIVIFKKLRRHEKYFFKASLSHNNYKELNEGFSLLNLFKRHFPLNTILLSILIILICFLFVVNTRFFAGTDAWLHISIIKYITTLNYVPMNEYYGALGLHIFGSVFHFF